MKYLSKFYLKISFNEQMFFYVKQRESLENVNQLDIYGNVILRSVKIIHSSKEGEDLRIVLFY